MFKIKKKQENETAPQEKSNNIFEDILSYDPKIPAFSVLYARSGEWQNRKKAWINKGLKSELGRTCRGINSWNDLSINRRRAESTRKIANAGSGPTVFDPVLCELIYKWFTKEGSQVLDPFAGGSVRGIIAGAMNRKYWGSDLRSEQIEENYKQYEDLLPPLKPAWVVGDSIETVQNAPNADFIFSCPPYGNLEKYSDDPKDLSTMDYHAFKFAYKRIILKSINKLNDNRFACFVVGDFRDNKGYYRGFVKDTIEAFEECGTKLYNEAILVTMVGSGSLRLPQFQKNRKFIKTHQNVLVFCKGDWRKAVEYLTQ